LDKVISAEEAARFIKNGMTIGMSGFTRTVWLGLSGHKISAKHTAWPRQ
jgi:acyl CoA:acetate/3-ketoacid CoA transferase